MVEELKLVFVQDETQDGVRSFVVAVATRDPSTSFQLTCTLVPHADEKQLNNLIVKASWQGHEWESTSQNLVLKAEQPQRENCVLAVLQAFAQSTLHDIQIHLRQTTNR